MVGLTTRSFALALALTVGLGFVVFIASYRMTSGDWPFDTAEDANALGVPDNKSLGLPEAFLLPTYLPDGYRLSGVRLSEQGERGKRFPVANLNFTSDERIEEWLYMIQWEGEFPSSEPDPETKAGDTELNGIPVGIYWDSNPPEVLELEWYDPSSDVGGYLRSYLALDETVQIIESMQ